MTALLVLLAGCGLFQDDATRPRVSISKVPIPAEASSGGSTLVLERPDRTAFAWRGHVDTAGAWVLAWVGEGLDAELLPLAAEGLVFQHVSAEGTPARTLPVPPVTYESLEAFDAAVSDAPFLPTVVPGHAAVVLGSSLWRFDGSAWSEEPLTTGLDGLGCLGVGPERAAFRNGLGELVVLEDGNPTTVSEVPGAPGAAAAWGPFDGDVVRAAWLPSGEVCTGRYDLASGTMQASTCTDIGVALGFASSVTGSVDTAYFVLTTAVPDANAMMPTRLSDAGAEILGRRTTFQGTYPDVLDDPQTDFAVLRVPDPGFGYGEHLLTDGTWDFVRDPPEDIVPARACPCDADDTPDVCWCLDRRYPVDLWQQVAPQGYWLLGAELHDARWMVWADRFTDPHVETSADPTFELGAFDPDALQTGLEPFVDAPGWPGMYADADDLFACTTVVDDAGNLLLPENGRYPVDPFTTYTLTFADCQPPDGGPPLVPITAQTTPGVYDAFSLLGASLGRGWPLDAVSDPPEVVTAVGHALLLVRETTGWTLIEQDGTGIRRTTVAAVGAAAPRILEDGRVLLAGGELFDPAASAVSATVALQSDPADTVDLRALLVEDTADLLRVTDVSTSPPTVRVEESGPRAARLLDLSDDGRTLLETDDVTVWVRRIGVGTASLGDVSVALRRAELSAAGDIAVVGLQTSAVSVQQSSLTAWGIREETGLVATSVPLCTDCGARWAFDRATGAVLGPQQGLPGLAIHRPNAEVPGTATWAVDATEVWDTFVSPPAPYTVEPWSTDAYGWAWFWDPPDLVGFDFGADQTAVLAGFDPAVEVRADADGLAWIRTQSQVWHRVAGPGTWEPHHVAVPGGNPVPVSGGRAGFANVFADTFGVGDWVPGDATVTAEIEVTRFQPDLLPDIGEPRYAELPCLPYRLGAQPAFVVDAPTWACVR